MAKRLSDEALSRLRRMETSSVVGADVRALLDERERTRGALEAARHYASSVAIHVFTTGNPEHLQEDANTLIDMIDAALWE